MNDADRVEVEWMRARVRDLDREIEQYKRLAIDADDVALLRGDRYGLCDSFDNDGKPYPSAWADALIRRARADLVDSRAALNSAPQPPEKHTPTNPEP